MTMQDTLTIRVDAALKEAAERIAAEHDETLSQVLRRALRDYVTQRGQSDRLIRNTYSGRKKG
jgi:predicted transcriptional regulator